jgi:hypothetical protein
VGYLVPRICYLAHRDCLHHYRIDIFPAFDGGSTFCLPFSVFVSALTFFGTGLEMVVECIRYRWKHWVVYLRVFDILLHLEIRNERLVAIGDLFWLHGHH